MTIEKLILLVDLNILAWLVFTWFYEGHHKRCAVEVECPTCHVRSNHDCAANPKRAS